MTQYTKHQLTVGKLKKLLLTVPDNIKIYAGFQLGETPVNCLTYNRGGIVFSNEYHIEEYQPIIWTAQTIAYFSKELDKESIKEQINYLTSLL